MSGAVRYIGEEGKTMKGEDFMTEYNMLATKLLNGNIERIGGMVMKAFKTLTGLVKKVFGGGNRAIDSYSFNGKQYGPVFETTESYYYMEQLIKKYKPAE